MALKYYSYTLSMAGRSETDSEENPITLAEFYSDYTAENDNLSINFSSKNINELKTQIETCMTDFKDFTNAAIAVNLDLEIEPPADENYGEDEGSGEDEDL